VILETRDNVVVRMRPRSNDDVNKFFACDYGRLNYRWINRRDRVEMPYVRRGDALVSVDWEVALAEAARVIAGKRVFVLASPRLSNEALYLLGRLAKRTGGQGVFQVETGPEAPLPGVEDLALRADRAANVRGAESFGFSRSEAPLGALRSGDVLLVADEELAGAEVSDVTRMAGNAADIVVLGTTLPAWAQRAAAVLPIANFAEEEGTFTNLRGRVQRFFQAKAAPGLARPSWYVLSDLLAAVGEPTNYSLASEVFAALAATSPEFAGLSYDTLGLRGRPMAGAAEMAGSAR
jgi:NADH-quinone oxidoreductase subunit G